MKVQLVVFDVAGTTVYDGDAVGACLRTALAGAGITVSRDAVNAVMGIPKPLAIRTLLLEQSAPATTEEVDAIHDSFLSTMLEHYRTGPDVREIAGASTIFSMLRAAGVKVALDTGFSRPIVDAILDRLGWEAAGLLDATVSSDEVARGRPYPDLILRAMDLTGITDAACVAKVGDTPSDLQEGQAARCGWVIGVTEGSHTRAELEIHPHSYLIPTIADLMPCLQ